MTSRSSRVATLMLVSACARSSAETWVKCTTYTGVWCVSISCSSVSWIGVETYSEISGTGRSDVVTSAVDRPGTPAEIGLEPRRVAQRRRHQQELRLGQLDQRHLPRPAAVRVGVEVELVHHDQADVGAGAFAQRHVGEDLGGRGDDRRIGVDRGVTGDHADVVGAEDLAEVEELLADERLDRRGVDAALTAGQRRGHRSGRHEALAGAGRRRQDHVGAGDALEDRLVLRGIERQPAVVDPLRDRVVDDVLVRRHAFRQQIDEAHTGIVPRRLHTTDAGLRPIERRRQQRRTRTASTAAPTPTAQPTSTSVSQWPPR